MGIRFYCPNGHKLHVKTFLAGLSGICPQCGAKVEIPLESTRESSSPRRRAEAARAETAKEVAPKSEAGAEAGQSVLDPTVDEMIAGVADEGASVIIPAAAQPTQASANEYTLAPDNPNAPDAAPPIANTPPVSAAPSAAPPSPAAADLPLAVPMAAGQGSAAAGKTTAPAGRRDPIVEAPQAVWYVRPATGGQFGPAAAGIMRLWIKEGRVSGDSLVWRAGWPEWQSAAAVFWQLAPAPAPIPVKSPEQPKPETEANQPAGPFNALPVVRDKPVEVRPRGRRSRQNMIALTVLLGILWLILLVVLVVVLRARRAPEDEGEKAAAVAPMTGGEAIDHGRRLVKGEASKF